MVMEETGSTVSRPALMKETALGGELLSTASRYTVSERPLKGGLST